MPSVYAAEHRTPYYRIALDPRELLVAGFSVDSLGQKKVDANPVAPDPKRNPTTARATFGDNSTAAYRLPSQRDDDPPAWEFAFAEKSLAITSRAVDGNAPLVLRFDQDRNHATLLGRMKPASRQVALPCILHLPDMGSVRISADVAGAALDYDARRWDGRWVQIGFPPPDSDRPSITYRLEVVAIHPAIDGIEKDERYDGFRRNYLNIFQLNPRLGVLANNASSDPVAFTLHEYAEMARFAPPLAGKLTCMDLVRMTLDRYLAGMKGYGLVGYTDKYEGADTISWKSPHDALDAMPSLVIAACLYASSTKDMDWAKANNDKLREWSQRMMKGDTDGNGLVEYPLSGNTGSWKGARPANWWDCVGFGHEDAYCNALAYRALVLMSDLARRLNKGNDARAYAAQAAKLKSAYIPAFCNKNTGWLAGWRSADGRLHDYAFTFITATAIAYGVVDPDDGRPMLRNLLAEMQRVRFTDYTLGLPGNLRPIIPGDYAVPEHRWGAPKKEDGSDAFQIYENGGATACHAFYFIESLHKVGLHREADAILFPMLKSFAAGDFQGRGANGMSKDWKTWKGECWGYEGFLVDGYLTLLAPVTRGGL